ncbi:MAG: hypothetical protein J0L62_06830 [Bacteroidetes bacterium]|nr:hypothetical protein [Bacteroidota bacterium]
MIKFTCSSILFLILFAPVVSAQQHSEIFYFQNGDSLEGLRLKGKSSEKWLVQKRDGNVVEVDSTQIIKVTVQKWSKPKETAQSNVNFNEIYSDIRLMGVFGVNFPTGFWEKYSANGLVFGADLIIPLSSKLNWHLMADYQWNLQRFENQIVPNAWFDDGSSSYGPKSWKSIWVLTGPSFVFAGENDKVRFEPGVGIGFSYISYPWKELFDENISESANLAYEVSLPFFFGKTNSVEVFGRWTSKSVEELRYKGNYERYIVSVKKDFNEVGIRLKFRLERNKSPKKTPF